jgi:hypothetical protein
MPYPWSAGNVLTATDLNSAFASKTDLAMTQNAQTGVSYSFALADASKLLTTSNASPVSVTVTKQATVTWVTGTQLRVMNLGAGVTTLVADTGVTINNNKSLGQYQGGTLIRTASDVWLFVPTVGLPSSGTATVDTGQTTSSTSFTDLATAGPAVTLTTGTKALVIMQARIYNSSTGGYVSMGTTVSGATTLAATEEKSLTFYSASNQPISQASAGFLLSGLTAGSNTFTAKYKTTAGTGTWLYRNIAVIDMGS